MIEDISPLDKILAVDKERKQMELECVGIIKLI
jgi:hypothetical protein